MKAEAAPNPDQVKISKIRGTLVSLDLINRVITIQRFKQGGKRVYRIRVIGGSEIVLRSEPMSLADLRVGDWVRAVFSEEEGGAILKRLYVTAGSGPG